MGFFKFLTGETVDEEKITTYLHLMYLVMYQDGEESDSENIYMRNYIASLNLNKFHTNRIMKKMMNITLDEALETAKKLSDNEQNELINKMMEMAKIDGKIDGEEAFMISNIATILDLDVDKVVNEMITTYGFDKNELDNVIEDIKNKKNIKNNTTQSVTNEENAVISLGLMKLVAVSDDDINKSEQRYINSYLSDFTLEERNRIASKIDELDNKTILNNALKLDDENREELLLKLMDLAKSDGKLDSKEAITIMVVARKLNINIDAVVEVMVNDYDLNENELKQRMDEIEGKSNGASKPKFNEREPIGFKKSNISTKPQVSKEPIGFNNNNCSNCGSEQKGNKFCSNCGKKM